MSGAINSNRQSLHTPCGFSNQTMTAAATEAGPVTRGGSLSTVVMPLTMRDLLTPAFRFQKEALLGFLVPVILALAAALFAHTSYVSQARLLVLLGNDYALRSDPNASTTPQPIDRTEIVRAEMEILGSRDLRVQTLKTVGLSRVYPGMSGSPAGIEAAALNLDRDLKIESVPQSSIIELSVKNRDAAVASDVLKKLLELYIERRRVLLQESDLGSVTAQQERLRKDLVAVEAQLTAFSSEHNLGDFNQEFTAVQERRAALATQLLTLDQQLATQTGREGALDAKLRALPGEVELSADQTKSQEAAALTESLTSLKAQRRDAAAKFTDDYPLVATLDARIARVQTQLNSIPKQEISAVRRGVNTVHQEVSASLVSTQGDIAGLKRGRAEVAAALASVDARVRELVEIGPKWRDLARQRTLLETSVLDISKRAAFTQLESSLARSQANVRIIQTPQPPTKGNSGRSLILATGVALGMVSAVTVIVLLSALSQSITTPGELEKKLDLPAILAVPIAKKAPRPATGGLPGPTCLTKDNGEMLTQLLLSVAPKSGRVFQLISANPDEGVTTLILDIAVLAAAQAATRVLILDIHPDDDGAAKRLAARGATLLSSTNENIIRVADTTLNVSSPVGSKGLVVVESAWEQVLERSRSQYDLILIDSPPIARSSVGVILSPLADLTLVVVEAETTRAASVRNLIERIHTGGGSVLGAILNKRQFHIPQWLYEKL